MGHLRYDAAPMTAPRLTRRAFAAAGVAAVALPALADEPPHDVTYLDDFDELWRTLGERYGFLADKATDWDQVRRLYRPLALAAETDVAFTEVVRRVLAELYDPHTHLSDPPDGSPRWPLFDLLAEPDAGAARIAAVEADSAAADAGLAIGDRIVAIDGRPLADVVRDLMPRCLTRSDPAADRYALNVAVAGRRGQPRRFDVLPVVGGAPRAVALPLKSYPPDPPDLEWRALAGGLGYIRIRGFAQAATVAAFDQALAWLVDAPGLIVDVRDNGGGDTAVARPIMGRFIAERRPYALMRRRDGPGLGPPWTEYVEPRGPFTYARPVVVLTNPWSASMAEGFPMGMRDIGRARVVGTPMMGLGAAVFPIRLDRTGLAAQYSAEPVYDTAGAPRSAFRPDVETAPGADILAAGLTELRRLIATS